MSPLARELCIFFLFLVLLSSVIVHHLSSNSFPWLFIHRVFKPLSSSVDSSSNNFIGNRNTISKSHSVTLYLLSEKYLSNMLIHTKKCFIHHSFLSSYTETLKGFVRLKLLG
nr:unnamed protein product [Mus musculus]